MNAPFEVEEILLFYSCVPHLESVQAVLCAQSTWRTRSAQKPDTYYRDKQTHVRSHCSFFNIIWPPRDPSIKMHFSLCDKAGVWLRSPPPHHDKSCENKVEFCQRSVGTEDLKNYSCAIYSGAVMTAFFFIALPSPSELSGWPVVPRVPVPSPPG